MRASWTIAKRELKSLFVSPVAYVGMGLFALLSGFQFVRLVEHFDALLQQAQVQASLQQNQDAFSFINLNGFVIVNLTSFSFFILLFVIPAITMRLLSEEKARGTYELLLTSPVSSWDIALGKFMAATLFFLILLSTHILPLGVMFLYGNPEPLPVLSSYLGLFLGGLVFIAGGLFASSITRSQFIAVIFSLGINLVFLFVGDAARSQSGNLQKALEASSLFFHFDNFNKGLITVSGLVFLATVVIFFLTATKVAIQAQTRAN